MGWPQYKQMARFEVALRLLQVGQPRTLKIFLEESPCPMATSARFAASPWVGAE